MQDWAEVHRLFHRDGVSKSPDRGASWDEPHDGVRVAAAELAAGVDVDGGLHVIETKIGPDHMLGIQGLDYWAWVTARKDEITELLELEPTDKPVELHYVVATSDKSLIHPAAAETMRRLVPEIPWRCHVITDWNTVDNPRQLLRPRVVPGIRPRTVPDPARLERRQK